jgi:hypothetical protein
MVDPSRAITVIDRPVTSSRSEGWDGRMYVDSRRQKQKLVGAAVISDPRSDELIGKAGRAIDRVAAA